MADKGFGQHFLSSPRVVAAIVEASLGLNGILEVGPGPGILTGPLSQFAQVHALELDARMIPAARESAPEADIVHQDALSADWPSILASLPQPVGIVSNMPYNITGPLLGRTADCAGLISRAVLMMQAEVAQRILALPGDSNRGSLSVWLQAVFEIRKVIAVPKGCFMPPPKVESTVLLFLPRASKPDQGLLDLVRQGFRQPRKTLANNLAQIDGSKDAIERAHLKPSIRPHELTWDDWETLWQTLRA